jgi:hypothetical protein
VASNILLSSNLINRALFFSQYLDMILREWGNWELFQYLLRALRVIGDRHNGVSIANVATRWVLDHAFVGAVLIGELLSNLFPDLIDVMSRTSGARLGLSEHPDDNYKVFQFRLTEQDKRDIAQIIARSNGPHIISTIGDCGAEYRAIEV